MTPEIVTHPLTVEQLLLVISVLFVPAGGGVYWLASKISSLEAEVRSITSIKHLEHEHIIERVARVEKSLHDVKNTLQMVELKLAELGHKDEKHNH